MHALLHSLVSAIPSSEGLLPYLLMISASTIAIYACCTAYVLTWNPLIVDGEDDARTTDPTAWFLVLGLVGGFGSSIFNIYTHGLWVTFLRTFVVCVSLLASAGGTVLWNELHRRKISTKHSAE